MKIGIISDTHNSLDVTRRALEVLRDRGIRYLVHAGDITSPKMLSLFRDFECRFVLGNGDIDEEDLNLESERLGFGCIADRCTIEIDNKKILLFHGNNVPLFREAVSSGEYDYIIKGHTHMFEDYTSNRTHIINPGSLYGADEFSIAILDTETDRVEMIRIDQD